MPILGKSTYRAEVRNDTLMERQQSAGYSATDYGRMAGMAFNAQAAWDRNMTLAIARFAKTKMLGDETSPSVTEEDFAK